MLCVACGGDIPAGSKFCPRCGRATSAVEGSAAPPDNPGLRAEGPPPGPPPEPPKMPQPPPPPPPPPAPPPPSSYGGAPGGYAGPPPAYGPPPGAYPPQGGYGATTGGPVAEGLADFGQRVGGAVIDFFIVFVATFVFGFIIALVTGPSDEYSSGSGGPGGLDALAWIASAAYYVILEGRPEGQTLGKKAMGIRVVRKANGAPLGYGLAVGRYLARFVDAITLGLGLLWAAWDPQRQTFHDKIAGTLVVRSSVYPAPNQVGSGPPGYS